MRALRIGLALFAFFAAGCAVTRFIAESTYPDYYEVNFVSGKGASTLFCTREEGDAGLANVLNCIDGAEFIDTMFGGGRPTIEARFTVEPRYTVEVLDGGSL